MMVAYSFKSRFADPILAGIKGGTIRADRRRHARPGEEIQLYSGMRTKQCRLIARKTCVDVAPIYLDFPGSTIITRPIGLIHQSADLDRFARFDGFGDFGEMSNFWSESYFRGWHIRWMPLPEAVT